MKEKQNDLYVDIGRKLRILREEKGITLEYLSRKMKSIFDLHISSNMLGKIERGESRLATDQFLSFCRFYKIDISYFFPDDDTDKMPKEISSLISSAQGRECIRQLGKYSLREDILGIIVDFLKFIIPKIDVQHSDKIKDKSLLKAASPGKLK